MAVNTNSVYTKCSVALSLTEVDRTWVGNILVGSSSYSFKKVRKC